MSFELVVFGQVAHVGVPPLVDLLGVEWRGPFVVIARPLEGAPVGVAELVRVPHMSAVAIPEPFAPREPAGVPLAFIVTNAHMLVGCAVAWASGAWYCVCCMRKKIVFICVP